MKKKNRRLTKGEKGLYILGMCAFGFTFLLEIFFGTNIGHLNMSIEKLRYNITTQEKKIESLQMKENELTAFDNVKDVAKNMGLAYNNENIIVIGE